MLENIALIAVIVLALWGGSLFLYFRTSGRHVNLENRIEQLAKRLGDDEVDV
ncbi:MAG TPA: hypothetical protein VLL52_23565 [Anaerolineae bacterium]|nr:hypothetical protein [Anaerolineae bacterium]